MRHKASCRTQVASTLVAAFAVLMAAGAPAEPPAGQRDARQTGDDQAQPPPAPARPNLWQVEQVIDRAAENIARRYGYDEQGRVDRDAYQRRRRASLQQRERFQRVPIPPPYRGEYSPAAPQAYDRGFDDGFEQGWLAAMEEMRRLRGESVYEAAMADGIEAFREADYSLAVRSFLHAAKRDQGDPIARLHAAQALTALGHYDEAFDVVRRAFQLQPNLAYLPLDVRGGYEDVSAFNAHVDKLRGAASAESQWKASALLGYLLYYSDEPAGAYRAFRRAAQSVPHDPFVAQMLEAARLAVPASASETQGR